jgi:hypothetical protein
VDPKPNAQGGFYFVRSTRIYVEGLTTPPRAAASIELSTGREFAMTAMTSQRMRVSLSGGGGIRAVAHSAAVTLHGFVILIGALGMLVMAIAVVLDGGSRLLERKAGR